jgi:acyl-CoA thioester hydrolase
LLANCKPGAFRKNESAIKPPILAPDLLSEGAGLERSFQRRAASRPKNPPPSRSQFVTEPRKRHIVRPEEFPHRTVETIRFGDLDRQNHVNNAVFATHFESGRVIILYGEEYGLVAPGANFVLARLAIDFLGEMHWPGEVEIGTAISRVGNSSIDLFQALFVKGACVATADNTLVMIDTITRKPRPFAPEHAARIRASAPAAPGYRANTDRSKPG